MLKSQEKSKGGLARAASLTPEQRKEIAKKGADARWSKPSEGLTKASHSGDLPVGDIILPCFVLENGTRVLSARGISMAFTGKIGGGFGAQKLPRFLASKDVNPFISQDLMARILEPIEFNPGKGRSAFGYEATLLPEICEVILDANKDYPLRNPTLAVTAEILIRGLARVGIIALIDEATGYQQDRERDALAKLLSIYLTEERLKWAKIFPDDFYKEVYRLNKWAWPPAKAQRTPLVGKYTNEVVYERLPDGVLDKLRKLNPVDPETKRRRWKYTQFLTEDFGQPDLRNHLLQVMALMRASSTWDGFLSLLNRAIPKGKEHRLTLDI